ncbi:hypothetical protein [Microbacterium hydrocarbonoxydans]|uniref:hypothetical protein n=1 Tax=Microbacterium hydrocarbonoxydans TaxID=273678 RepID=UPI00203EED15|nr:hypothetical protein [Microbacterium hydrocarbonoxydans]MCM3780654.1 hypothetical protein [Microbacterium hydrocarbonoxydans]
MPDDVRLILNRTSEPPRVLHREDCPTIQHQVRGDVREERPRGGFAILESYEDGLSLIGPVEGVDRSYYTASYVTIEQLASVGRYRRCKTCAPDAPDGPPPLQVHRKKAENLEASDIGRVSVDGAIERIEHSSEGTTVTLNGGVVLTLGAGDTVSFPKKPQSA